MYCTKFYVFWDRYVISSLVGRPVMPHCLHVTIIRGDSLEHFKSLKIQVKVNSFYNSKQGILNQVVWVIKYK